jgi:hypothetical protein
VSLVCDSCGTSIKNIECAPEHWPVMWSVVTRVGWAGAPVAIGPHHCPQCSETGQTGVLAPREGNGHG